MLIWKQMVKRGTIIIALSFSLYALVTLLFIVFSPVSRPSTLLRPIQLQPERAALPAPASLDSEIDYWRKLLAFTPPPLKTRILTITVSADSMALNMELWITNTHEITRKIQQGELESEQKREAFVRAVFGKIKINSIELAKADFTLPRWTIENGLMHLKLGASRKLTPWRNYWHFWIDRGKLSQIEPSEDRIVTKLDGVRLSSSTIQPESSSETFAVFSLANFEPHIYLDFDLLTAAEERRTTPDERPRETRQHFLNRFGNLVNIPLISRLLFSIVEAFPLLMFLYLLRRTEDTIPPFAFYLGGTVVSLLLFHFTLYYLAGSSDLMYSVPAFEGIASALRQFIHMPFKILSFNIESAPSFTAPMILGILVPMLLFQRTGYFDTEQRAAFIYWLIPVASMLVIGAGWGVYFIEIAGNTLKDVPLVAWMGLATLVIVGLSWIILYVLYRQLSEHQPKPFLLWLAALTLPLNILLEQMSPAWAGSAWLILSVLYGLFLLLSLFYLVHKLVQQASLVIYLHSSLRLGLALLAILLVVPMRSFVGYSSQWALPRDIISLAYGIDDWIPIMWLGGLLWLLYMAGKTGQRIDAFTRMMGILGASMLFFNPVARWFYIPITFLLGWWALNRFVRPASHWKVLAPLFRRVFSERLALLEQILDLNNAEGAYLQFRKTLRTKLATGEDKLTFSQYDEQLAARRQELEQLREKTKIEGKSVREVALTFSPYPSAWENGVHGAKMALLFAVPWFILYLRGFLTSSTPQATYPLWWFALDLVFVTLKWTVFGFFFGYFYPYLRGNNGLRKGLGLFWVTVLPYLPLMVLHTTTPADWQARFFWMLQVFIQCMLLGLIAFDYQILRQRSYDWQMLFEVHGITGVGVSVSSILVAVGAAITTLLTSKATDLISLALKFILPETPSIPSLK